ncbi:ATP-dependent DNA helicase RecG [Natranaerovirga hydrolytica]|uniref:ATP-dependent DNA helicase RecG n=1 Tax=Natranaerovirga hydrolytica TaxID=680378 RepID=A0A4R1MYU5_9FIRM|nr:ATP-dependent DNA helicase RecG [Natranaerovirga hydrolytica]TCK98325.1 ATP-dependent DNA helicase RecG [Natranaerovirga hydrolytica]
MDTTQSISGLKGIGEKTEKLFNRLEIYTIEDLLHYYPRSYETYSQVTKIKDIKIDAMNAVEGTICFPIEQMVKGKFKILKIRIKDDTGYLYLLWFNQLYIKNNLKIGETKVFRGKAEYKYGQMQITTPEIFDQETYNKKTKTLQPIYALTKGIMQKNLSKIIRQGLIKTHNQLKDCLPNAIRNQYGFAEYNYAITQIHYPKDMEALKEAKRRLVFDEFFIFQLSLLRLKKVQDRQATQFDLKDHSIIKDIIKNLPFQLTQAQKSVLEEIKNDLMGETVMNRLLQGDVGSGKTIIAALMLALVAKNNYQGSIMAPTEVLAKQHFETMKALLEPHHINVGLLVGSMTAKEKKNMYQAIKDHTIDIVIGTHAIIQDKVVFNQLALVITDEQHRFGVKQRESLSQKGTKPHMLVMSATPIPRTLALMLYGDLDISIIDELPPNRQVIKTYAVDTSYRKRVYDFIKKQIKDGRQAYVICPMVEESDQLEVESVLEYTKKLKKEFDQSINIEYLHGKMKPKEKNIIMENFANNTIQVLVSTTVVEVGVNVPNATIIAIENADRFGLAQLHQLRGRVGRGQYQSYCILLTQSKSNKTKERLDVLSNTNDGFIISEYDLKVRGQGDLFGIKQHGDMEFKIANVFEDIELLKIANKLAKDIMKNDPQLTNEEHYYINERLKNYIHKYYSG